MFVDELAALDEAISIGDFTATLVGQRCGQTVVQACCHDINWAWCFFIATWNYQASTGDRSYDLDTGFRDSIDRLHARLAGAPAWGFGVWVPEWHTRLEFQRRLSGIRGLTWNWEGGLQLTWIFKLCGLALRSRVLSCSKQRCFLFKYVNSSDLLQQTWQLAALIKARAGVPTNHPAVEKSPWWKCCWSFNQ